ncbi:hypothetical protein [Demequina lutea]|uniref:Uncharacterized protein n=1 Tax=Demequina lutea TaxID=431489 RepID=A0A7Y9ZCC7_9MICO|nr:hypothetical protein [Demequina lutea]NYI42033.1 hypothetical protein [Demequina lutea]
MTKKTGRDPAAMVEKAVSKLPTTERERYAEEWRHDVAAAPDAAAALQVARAARSMSRRLWWRHAGLALLGQRGRRALVKAWLIVAALLVAMSLLGSLFYLVAACALVLTVLALLDAGVSSRVIRSVEVASVVLGASAFAYLWWAWGVAFDAADNFQPVPPAADHGALAGIILLACIVAFVAALATSLIRRKR